MSLNFFWPPCGQWTCWDLNPGPPPCKGGDLPADLQAPIARQTHCLACPLSIWSVVFRVFPAGVSIVDMQVKIILSFCFVLLLRE
jgi:hypothetical protein